MVYFYTPVRRRIGKITADFPFAACRQEKVNPLPFKGHSYSLTPFAALFVSTGEKCQVRGYEITARPVLSGEGVGCVGGNDAIRWE